MAQTVATATPLTMTRMATGTYLDTGTVAAYEYTTLGFQPRYVKVINETSGDTMEWIEGMANAEGYKRLAAGTGALVTSNGITVGARGFTIGLDTDINVQSEQVSWVAFG